MSNEDDKEAGDEEPSFELRDGEVLSNGEVVAKVDNDELKIKRGYGKYRAEIEQIIDEGEQEDDPENDDDEEGDTEETENSHEEAAMEKFIEHTTPPHPPAPPATQTRPDGVIEEGRRESEKYSHDVMDDIQFAEQAGVEPPPKKNPRFGDKTPAYVSWLREYRPKKYAEKFGIERKDQKVPIYDSSGEIVRYEKMDVGRRKTHSSEKIERDASLDESMDWNA